MIQSIKSFLWKWKYIFLFIGLFLVVLTQRFLNERQNGLVNSVSSDGLGYYCYLPAAVIYQDFSYQYYDNPDNKINPFYKPGLSAYKGRSVNKYYCGTSLCMLPFFALGVIISAISGTQINGYTDTFLMLVSVGALFYYLLSLFLLTKIGNFFKISEKISFAAGLVFFFGTNLFHYTIQEPSMSHVYSFFAVSLFLFLFIKTIEHKTNAGLFFLGLSLGLIILIRPVNVVVVLFTPFFFENLKDYLLFLKLLFVKHLKGIVFFALALGIAVLLQLVFYYLQTGGFYIVSYEGETFNFSNPEFLNVLFSYKKGLFLYVPILLLALVFIIVVKHSWFKKIIFFLTFSLFIYITASWWCWWYGGGFSIRPVVDVLPLFVITCMLFYSKLPVISKRMVIILIIPFLFMSQLMAYQYSNLIMDSTEMNKQEFWDIFLETDLATINQKKIDRILKHGTIVKTDLLDYENVFDDKNIIKGGYKSNQACVVGRTNYYSKGFQFPIKDLNLTEPFYVIIECMAKTSLEGKNLTLAISIDENGQCVKWSVVFNSQFKTGTDGWSKMTQVLEIDKKYINEINCMKIFANDDKGDNLVDNLKLTIVKNH